MAPLKGTQMENQSMNKNYARMVARLRASVPDEATVQQMLSDYERARGDDVKRLEQEMNELVREFNEAMGRRGSG